MDNLAASPLDSLPSGTQSPVVNYRRDRRRGSIFMRKNISDAIVGGLSDGLPPSQLKSLNLLAQTTRKQQQQQVCGSRGNLFKNKHTVHSLNQNMSHGIANQSIQGLSYGNIVNTNVLSSSPGQMGIMQNQNSTGLSRSGSHVQLQQPYSKNIFGRVGVVKVY